MACTHKNKNGPHKFDITRQYVSKALSKLDFVVLRPRKIAFSDLENQPYLASFTLAFQFFKRRFHLLFRGVVSQLLYLRIEQPDLFFRHVMSVILVVSDGRN